MIYSSFFISIKYWAPKRSRLDVRNDMEIADKVMTTTFCTRMRSYLRMQLRIY